MPCSRCGAEGPRRPIAPGFWECMNLVEVSWFTTEPMPGRPWMNQPRGMVGQQACKTRYHEAVSENTMPTACYCGTYAIGTCQVCSKPFCGDHSLLSNDRRICRTDWDEIRKTEEARRRANKPEPAPAESHADMAKGFSNDKKPFDFWVSRYHYHVPFGARRGWFLSREGPRLDERLFGVWILESIEYTLGGLGRDGSISTFIKGLALDAEGHVYQFKEGYRGMADLDIKNVNRI